MPLGLKRYQHEGQDHFVTFSCYGREPHLGTAHAKDTFLLSLELTRQSYGFEVMGYVVMPEHVHLLVSEPPDHEIPLATAIQALKISVSRRLAARPFWPGAPLKPSFGLSGDLCYTNERRASGRGSPLARL